MFFFCLIFLYLTVLKIKNSDMTLSFTQTIKGKPNYFVHKIWRGILNHKIIDADFVASCYQPYFKKFGETCPMMDGLDIPEKIHTIRQDPKRRWIPGKIIHPVINNRTPNRFQFAPTIPCKSTQRIDIIPGGWRPEVRIDGMPFYYWDGEIEVNYKGLNQLAINDGFESVDDFCNYFKTGITDGNLIHWTDFKY